MGQKERENIYISPKNNLTIEELGIDIVFGKKGSLRTSGLMTGLDLLKTAQIKGYDKNDYEGVLAYQLAISQAEYPPKEDVIMKGKHKKHAKEILYKGRGLPFFVGYTTKAILEYGLNEEIDNRSFLANFKRFIPKSEELKEHGFSQEDVKYALSEPAILVGSAALIYYDGVDEDCTYLRKRQSGLYKGYYTIPGGCADGPNDISGLAEMVEETGLAVNDSYRVDPLGVYDQLLIGERIERYLNIVWEVMVGHDVHLIDGDGGGKWVELWDSEVSNLVKRGELTPIAEFALNTAKFVYSVK